MMLVQICRQDLGVQRNFPFKIETNNENIREINESHTKITGERKTWLMETKTLKILELIQIS